MRDWESWWSSSTWRHEAVAWVEPTLARHGLSATGPAEQPRVRFWSTHLRIPTDGGTVWFKENNPAQAFEAALTLQLTRLAPGHVVAPLALDPARGWMLSPDAGPTLRVATGASTPPWAQIAVRHAALQRRVEVAPAQLLGAGLAPFPERELVGYVAAQMDRLRRLPKDHPSWLAPHRAEQIARGLPRLAAAAGDLDASGIPPSLQHNDLHDDNVVGRPPGGLRFIDLADAVWAHPFGSLRVLLASAADQWGLPWPAGWADPRLSAITDAYLEPWTELAPRGELRRWAAHGARVGVLARYESWRRLLANAPERHAFDVACYLEEATAEWGP